MHGKGTLFQKKKKRESCLGLLDTLWLFQQKHIADFDDILTLFEMCPNPLFLCFGIRFGYPVYEISIEPYYVILF